MTNDPQGPIGQNPVMAHRLAHRSSSLPREPTRTDIWLWRVTILVFAIIVALTHPYRGDVRINEFTFEGEVIRREVMAVDVHFRGRQSIYSTGILVRKRGLDTQWATVFPAQQTRQSAATDQAYKKNAAALLTLKNGDRATLHCFASNYERRCRLVSATNARGEKLVFFDRESIHKAVWHSAQSKKNGNRFAHFLVAAVVGFELLRMLSVFLWRRSSTNS